MLFHFKRYNDLTFEKKNIQVTLCYIIFGYYNNILKNETSNTKKNNNIFYLRLRTYSLDVLENHVANISRRVNVLKCSWYLHVHVLLFR